MGKKILLTLIVISCIIICKRSQAQIIASDTSQQPALGHIIDNYNTAINEQSRLYNGPEYDLYNPNIKGNAYFTDLNEFARGTVTYDGIFYKNVPMMYDMYKDVIVVLLYNKFSRYSLLSERVESLDLLNHHFIYIKTDSLNANAGISTGFYDQLYNGSLEVLVKRSKALQNTTGTNTIETYFTSSKSFYLKKGNSYYSIGSQSTMLKILNDKKKELQQYIKANKIKFKKTPEEALVAIAARYDELSR
ncbi:hypothetical protein [Mucilaginibacter pocheonensis]|uniref:Uncharacterized protein n=1 Tax=Mucilaginibacter pocheonensis TaxID=398050 RepID=A0ABU1T8H2_9SPHI|nr:hypothetical protein [Mucilaginibacter pocheonensis]MDR6941697.1 hypothetical protein [Mucilaginibacter pocheonensis]